MDIEDFARLHPIGYVHIAFAVVWVLQFGYAVWVAVQWRRAAREERTLAAVLQPAEPLPPALQ